MAPYRPPGRSNRSGRSNTDNDVFEGLPVKQWGQAYSKVSLAPPVSEVEPGKDDKWGEPPMPRDYQLLLPWTQHLLRLARSGKVGTKRKQDAEADEDKPDDEVAEDEPKQLNVDERGYVAKKWKPVPEHALAPEHKHFSFLAKRRKGLPNLYGPDQQAAAIPMRKTKVQKAGASGEVNVYEVLVPEGQSIEGEIAESTELADVKPVTAAPGTIIEGVGVANEEGVMVAEHLKPSTAPRRNRPPPKKKGGPGRGKKRVTFTNPDGSTYTAIVPNATKIVPQPGQTIKHVAKGEEAIADITVEEAAKNSQQQHGDEGGEEGSGDDDEEGDDDDDDDREDGEVSDDDDPATVTQAPANPAQDGESQPMEDVQPTSQPARAEPAPSVPAQAVPARWVPAQADAAQEAPAQAESAQTESTQPEPEAGELPPKPSATDAKTATDAPAPEHDPVRTAESSPDLPLAQSHSKIASLAEPAPLSLDKVEEEPAKEAAEAESEVKEKEKEKGEEEEKEKGEEKEKEEGEEEEEEEEKEEEKEKEKEEAMQTFEDGDEDLLGNLEKSLA